MVAGFEFGDPLGARAVEYHPHLVALLVELPGRLQRVGQPTEVGVRFRAREYDDRCFRHGKSTLRAVPQLSHAVVTAGRHPGMDFCTVPGVPAWSLVRRAVRVAAFRLASVAFRSLDRIPTAVRLSSVDAVESLSFMRFLLRFD